MSIQDKRDALIKKGIDPQIMQIIQMDELNGRLEELAEAQRESNLRAKAVNTLNGPAKRPFQNPLQNKTLQPGESGRVFFLRNAQPDLTVGIITRLANLRYQNTVIEQFIDYEPKTIEYVMGDMHAPLKVSMPFHREVEYIAYNNDTKTHTFEILCDGYFIPLREYNNL